MFDEIFKRWITSGQLTENDIVPVFLEWDKVFNKGEATPNEVITLLHIVSTDYFKLTQYALKILGIKKGYHWEEVYSPNGFILNRFFV